MPLALAGGARRCSNAANVGRAFRGWGATASGRPTPGCVCRPWVQRI